MPGRLSGLQKAEAPVLILFAVWLLLILLAPLTLAHGSVADLSGSVGTIDNADQISGMNPFAAAIYWLGDANCHQLASRSYYLNGNEMPFCARDLGIFIGMALGMALAFVTKVRPPFLLLILGLVPMALDGGLQLLTDYESTNPVRLLTGMLAGVSVAFLIHLIAMNMRDIRREKRPDRSA
ncbi:MAG: DUF2085 domain-containing protein [Methanomassiliicoccales archaeon]|jgi:uncharacterized membrane protein|nr:DUF2085 domain-containing protein [Methanomassiliicoccales archaeon]MDD1755289.1 DUF2085 domain-containing protein [Methanomassiliicoccales archaeon]